MGKRLIMAIGSKVPYIPYGGHTIILRTADMSLEQYYAPRYNFWLTVLPIAPTKPSPILQESADRYKSTVQQELWGPISVRFTHLFLIFPIRWHSFTVSIHTASFPWQQGSWWRKTTCSPQGVCPYCSSLAFFGHSFRNGENRQKHFLIRASQQGNQASF